MTSAEPHSVASLAAVLRARGDERLRIAVVGLSPDAFTGGATRALACELAGTGRALTVDLDFSGPAPAGAGAAKGLADLVRGKASFGEIIGRGSTARLHTIAAGDPTGDPASILSSERLAIALDALQRAYDHVVIDFGAMPDIEDERLAKLAPCVVLYSPSPMPEAVSAAEDSLRAAGCREVLALNGEFPTDTESAAAA